MIEPVAYMWKNKDDLAFALSKIEPAGEWDIVTPLYTSEKLHPRVKMTQAEFDEFKKLLSVGISTIYEAFDVIDSDRGETDEFEKLYNRLFTNGVNAQAKNQIEFSKLWDSLSNSSAEETIEIVPGMKWFVRSKEKDNGDYQFLAKSRFSDMPRYTIFKSCAHRFETKEEAEKWTNPLTEAVQLPVEGE